MSPAHNASRLREIAGRIRTQRLHVVAAELAVQGLRPDPSEIPAAEQIEAVSELLQDIAQGLDEHAASLAHEAEREERVA